MYRPGFGGQLLPLEMRPQTRFAPDPRALRRDGVPACRMFPLRFIGKLLAARLEMAFGR